MGAKYSYPQTPELTIASDKFRLKPYMLEKMWKLFLENDKDRSGFLDVKEFHKMFKEGNSPFLRQLFRSNDINTDEQLTYPEFIELVGGFCLYDEKAMIEFAFSAFDKDGNGAIERDEFRLLIETLETNVAGEFPKQVEKALQLFDANRDGNISLEEFTEMNLRFPQLLWPAFRLQYRVQEATLGLTAWRKHQEQLKAGDIVTRRRKVCKYCFCAGFEPTAEELRAMEEAKAKEVPMEEANKDGKMKASVKRRKREERLRREGLPPDYPHEASSKHSDEGKRMHRRKSGSDKSRKKKLSRKGSHRQTKVGTKTKSSKGKKGTLKKTKSSAGAGKNASTAGLGARKHSSAHEEKKESPKAASAAAAAAAAVAVGDVPRHRSLHSIRIMKRQQSAHLHPSTDLNATPNDPLAAGIAAHKELMAAAAVAAAVTSPSHNNSSSPHAHAAASSGGVTSPSAAKYASPTGASRGSPTPVLHDTPHVR